MNFASARSVRIASKWTRRRSDGCCLCLGAFRADCIITYGNCLLIMITLPRRVPCGLHRTRFGFEYAGLWPLPRRVPCGLHRQKCTKHDVQFRGMCRESVDSFSRHCINMPCADYFPVLFCCQGDLYRHCRQPRTDNRPGFLMRTAALFYVCLGFALADTLVNSHTGWRFWDRGQVLNRLLVIL